MQYLTSKPSLLLLLVVILGALTLVWFKYSRGIDALNKDRTQWEENYNILMERFTTYRAKVPTIAKNSQLDWNSVENDKILSHSLNWENLRKLEEPPKNEMHDKWIIVTTISAPTNDIKKLAQVQGWKLIVVADKKTPLEWP